MGSTPAVPGAVRRRVRGWARPRRTTFEIRWALLLAVVGLAVVGMQVPVIAEEPFFVGVNVAVVLSWLALGHYLVERHRQRFTGLCFCAAAGGWALWGLDIYPAWGVLLSWCVAGAAVYTPLGLGVLRYGRDRLDPAGRRWVVLALAGTAGTSVLLVPVSRPEWLAYPPDAFWPSISPDPIASSLVQVLACAGYLLIGYTFARLVLHRLRTAPPVQRALLRPLTLASAAWGAIAAGVTILGTLAPHLLSIHANSNVVGVLSLGVTAALTMAVTRSHALASAFVESLPTRHTPDSLNDYVRSALSDPTAELLFVVPRRDVLIDASGRLRSLPDDRVDRLVQWIAGSDGEHVAVLLGDPLLREELTAVHALTKVLSLVAENQQLHTVLRLRLAQLGAARTAERLAFDRAREQFRRDLHDGVQQTIAAARMDLEGVRDDPLAVDDVDGKLLFALDQIRNLKQGTRPPELAFGLGPAVDRMTAELHLRATCRIEGDDLGILTLPVYFLLREALTNTHKHARGAAVEVVVEQVSGLVEVRVSDSGPGGAHPRPGGGLTGLRERVSELGGRFTVDSPIRAGTTLRASIPVLPV